MKEAELKQNHIKEKTVPRMQSEGELCQRKPHTGAFMILMFLTLMTLFYYINGVQQHASFSDYSGGEKSDTILEGAITEGFVVSSSLCGIPNISAFHPSINKYIHDWKPLTCSKTRPLTRVLFNRTSGLSSLEINENAVLDYSISKTKFKCCYRIISRRYQSSFRNENDDDRYELTQDVCFSKKNSVRLPSHAEFLYVFCHHGSKKKKFYETLHSIVVEKNALHAIPVATNSSNTVTVPKFSVLLFGIDSISRLSFFRTMPKTREYLEQGGWNHLEGYNKVADNTFPNLIAILTGLTVSQLRARCFSEKSEIDDCPFLWQNYSRYGYLTAYAEDEALIGTFNYHKYGFLNSPTNYYTRPYMIVGLDKLKLQYDGGMRYCMGLLPQAEYLFEYATQFVQRLHNRLYFKLLWFNSFSHNDVNMPSVMDVRVRQTLRDIQPYLNYSIVFFFSDHGVRFGPIRETYVGWLEERLPFMYLWIPQSFRAHYPHKYANLVANKNRLTSPFDVYATLQDILHGIVVEPVRGCLTCDSLFNKAAWNRSCEDAGIPAHWCTCSIKMGEDRREQTDNPVVIKASHTVIQHINQFMEKKKAMVTKKGFKCARLTLKKVISVKVGQRQLRVAFSKQYVIVFEVNPSAGMFEVTWSSHTPVPAIEDISRINMYGNQSSCVAGDSELRKFCYCMSRADFGS